MNQASNADLTTIIKDLHEVIKNINKEYQVHYLFFFSEILTGGDSRIKDFDQTTGRFFHFILLTF